MSAFFAPAAAPAGGGSFRLTAGQSLCVGDPQRRFVMGGVSFAAAIDALEQASARPLIWASAQFLAAAAPEAALEIVPKIASAGGKISQAEAQVRADGRTIAAVRASLGRREGFAAQQFVPMPSVPPPEACEPLAPDFPPGGDLRARFDRREAMREGEAQGQARRWFRSLDNLPVSAGLLAVVADFLAGGHAQTMGAVSLDNLVRMHSLEAWLDASPWLLCDTQFSSFADGLCHGDMRIFAQHGTLLASASQSGMMPRA